jgi:hypothetical protein
MQGKIGYWIEGHVHFFYVSRYCQITLQKGLSKSYFYQQHERLMPTVATFKLYYAFQNNGCKITSQCCFDLHIFDCSWVKHLFTCLFPIHISFY